MVAENVNMKAVAAELIGTFILVFMGTATAVLAGSGLLGLGGMGILAIAFAFGFTLMVLAYAIGPVSGCHVNPAVTIAMLHAKKIRQKDAMYYVGAQLVGGFAASAILLFILAGIAGNPSAGVAEYSKVLHGLGANDVPSFMTGTSQFLLEVVLTALFLFVILSVTSPKGNSQLSGFAIGGYLFVAHLIGVPLGGSSLNPARSLGPALFQGGTALANVWVFILGPIVGALVGYYLYSMISRK